MTELSALMLQKSATKPTRPCRRMALAIQLDLVAHLPPSGPSASINFPGITLFIVVIGPDIEVHLPPEQKCSEWFDEHLKLERIAPGVGRGRANR
jgi:hypothetical protein